MMALGLSAGGQKYAPQFAELISRLGGFEIPVCVSFAIPKTFSVLNDFLWWFCFVLNGSLLPVVREIVSFAVEISHTKIRLED